MIRDSQQTHLGPCRKEEENRPARCIYRHRDLSITPIPPSMEGIPPQILVR